MERGGEKKREEYMKRRRLRLEAGKGVRGEIKRCILEDKSPLKTLNCGTEAAAVVVVVMVEAISNSTRQKKIKSNRPTNNRMRECPQNGEFL